MSKMPLYISDFSNPIMLKRSHAVAIGLEKSIIISVIEELIYRGLQKHEFEDRLWVSIYNSKLKSRFPFFSIEKINKYIEELEEEGFLILRDRSSKYGQSRRFCTIDTDKFYSFIISKNNGGSNE